MANLKFPTLLIVSATSFFLGLLFSLFPYDYPLLWAPGPVPTAHLDAVESNLKLLYHCPKICFQIFHFMILVGLGALVAKLYKPSESNMLFDGGSLVLFMVGVIIYVSNIAKGLRIVDRGIYGVGLEGVGPDGEGEGGVQWGGPSAPGMPAEAPDSGNSVLGREDNLKVLSASNTILALVLLGILVLQVGQWYAERQDEKNAKEFEEQQRLEREQEASGAAAAVAVTPSSTTAGSKKSPASKEAKKNK